jgi:DNA-binding transcriptional LysR family regulator
MREQGSATRQLFEAWLMGAGLRLERTLVVSGPQAGLSLVAAGLGFTPVSSLASHERTASVVRLAVSGLRIARPITAAWHRGKHFHSSMKRLLELARRECEPLAIVTVTASRTDGSASTPAVARVFLERGLSRRSRRAE